MVVSGAPTALWCNTVIPKGHKEHLGVNYIRKPQTDHNRKEVNTPVSHQFCADPYDFPLRNIRWFFGFALINIEH